MYYFEDDVGGRGGKCGAGGKCAVGGAGRNGGGVFTYCIFKTVTFFKVNLRSQIFLTH